MDFNLVLHVVLSLPSIEHLNVIFRFDSDILLSNLMQLALMPSQHIELIYFGLLLVTGVYEVYLG